MQHDFDAFEVAQAVRDVVEQLGPLCTVTDGEQQPLDEDSFTGFEGEQHELFVLSSGAGEEQQGEMGSSELVVSVVEQQESDGAATVCAGAEIGVLPLSVAEGVMFMLGMASGKTFDPT